MLKKKYIILAVFPVVAAMTGCSKLEDFGDTNLNPAGTNTPILGALLTNVISNLGNNISSTRAGLYGQYFSETQYTDVSLYSLPLLNFNSDGGGNEYSGSLYDLQNIRNTNTSKNMSAVAKILQQYTYWTMTDRWGDIPYSEALKGNGTPKFDTQEAIYKGMIQALKEAVGEFDNTSVITGDVLYNGDAGKWKKFANSLRMLMSLRLAKRYPGASEYAATEFKAALSDPAGHISSNEDNLVMRFPGGAPANFKNPWFNTYDGRKDYAESKTMTDILTAFNDNRANIYGGASEVPGSTTPSTVGMPYGLTRAKSEAFTGANPTWAKILRGDHREITDASVIIGASQVLLARAQAADMGWTTENTALLYQQGITASFQQWGLTAPAASYFTQTGVALGAPGTNKDEIAIQRWIAAYPDGIQGWSIWRETGFPVLTPAPDAVNSSKQIPRRYVYGNGEYSTNPDNTKEAATRMGGDTQDTRVWWDKN